MGRVFVSRKVPGQAVPMLREAGHSVEVWAGELPPPPATLAARVQEADALLALLTDRIDAAMLERSPRLRVIANMAVGYDNVDPEVAAKAGVWVTNTPGVLAETTADFAFALLLDVARRVTESAVSARAGGWRTWSPGGFLGADVHGATLGIVGPGEIGLAVARRGLGFGMRVLCSGRPGAPRKGEWSGIEHVGLAELLAASDFVSLHVPLTEATRRMIGAKELSLMKRTAFLVNTSRGSVVDQDALVTALVDGEIAGAALDVTDPEPLPDGHPLYGMANVVITPHIASASVATRSRMAEMAAQNIIAALAGEAPPNAVNRPDRPRALRPDGQ